MQIKGSGNIFQTPCRDMFCSMFMGQNKKKKPANADAAAETSQKMLSVIEMLPHLKVTISFGCRLVIWSLSFFYSGFSKTIRAWKCNLPAHALSGNYNIQTVRRSKNQPTDQQTDIRGYREVTLPIISFINITK